MYICSCFGITESQIKQHAEAGACTPRQIASRCKAGTDCGSCVRRIQSILGRGACPRREQSDENGRPDLGPLDRPAKSPLAASPLTAAPLPAVASAPEPVAARETGLRAAA